MIPALLLTLTCAWIICLARYPGRAATVSGPVHPPEGYFFGDPASPTRAERERLLLGWGTPPSHMSAGQQADASVLA